MPYYAKWYRFWMFWRTAEAVFSSVTKDPSWNDQERAEIEANDELRQLLTAYMAELCADDQELLRKSIPHYPVAGKRSASG